VLDRQALEQANLTVTYADGPSLVGNHAFTTGQVGLRSFEKVLSPSLMKIGIEDGIGCYPDKLPQEEQTKAILPDQFQHELATAYNLKGRGLVILTACSHRGVVNTIKQAQAASGITKLHAVIGGFHLAPYAEDYVSSALLRPKRPEQDDARIMPERNAPNNGVFLLPFLLPFTADSPAEILCTKVQAIGSKPTRLGRAVGGDHDRPLRKYD
jgi:hypothetical protein